MPNEKTIHISEIPGFMVGHAENEEAQTGCTAILAPEGAVASAYVPGFAPGTRELELLSPRNLMPCIYGLLLSGGSAFGLAAAEGVSRFILDKGWGYKTAYINVPIVPAAVIYDYPDNRSNGRLPNEAMGYEAASNAKTGPLRSGRFGAGKGAMSGKMAVENKHSKSGIGSYGLAMESGLMMAALAVVNPLGSIVDPHTGDIISGVLHTDDTLYTRDEILEAFSHLPPDAHIPPVGASKGSAHTVLVAVATNAKLDKLNCNRLARMADCGVARSVYPAHLLFDGDVIFTLSTGKGRAYDVSYLGALAADMVAEAIVRSVPGREDG
jgi:L-aminopeptidase/D-esterase-like protein